MSRLQISHVPGRCALAIFLVTLFRSLVGFAQTTPAINPAVPWVSIVATDPVGSVSGDTATFTVFRHGNTNADLNVYYQIGGTASNGVDYVQISNFILIPAGSYSNTVTITPINHGQNGVATVVLHLAPSPLLTPVNYLIGAPDTAIAFIKGNDITDIPPNVAIVSPEDGAVIYTPGGGPVLLPAQVELIATAGDIDGSVTNVEFYAGTNDLGKGQLVILDPPGAGGVTGPVYTLNWGAYPGDYVLTAVATDNQGASTTSMAVHITVKFGPPPPTPVVRITSPPNHAVFVAPTDIHIFAFASGRPPIPLPRPAITNSPVTNVEFYADGMDLGAGHRLVLTGIMQPLTDADFVSRLGQYELTWSNAPAGPHVLTAVATDNHGFSATSAPVNITVITNIAVASKPDVVSIVATDPIAIEGTNCWVWLGLTNPVPIWAEWPVGVCRWFTNCGPKDATFVVRRFGVITNDLTVTYSIGGTATNGIDYVTLPGSVIIPAGKVSAQIVVAPVDDGPPDINKTVVLTLNPSASSPADYVLGLPHRAAAIIIDSNGTHPPTAVLPDKCFHLTATGPDGAWFCVKYSTDMRNWTPICTNQVVNGYVDFVDPDAQSANGRFYMAVPQP